MNKKYFVIVQELVNGGVNYDYLRTNSENLEIQSFSLEEAKAIEKFLYPQEIIIVEEVY